MLYASLFVSAVMLVLAIGLARNARYPTAKFIVLGFGTLFLQALLTMGSLTAPPIQWVLLIIIMPFVSGPTRSIGRCVGGLLAGTLLAYVLPTNLALQKLRMSDELRQQYPFVSMADRVPEPQPLSAELPKATIDRLERLESLNEGMSRWNYRTRILQGLHRDRVHRFVNSSGFGVTRMGPFSEGDPRLQPRDLISFPRHDSKLIENTSPGLNALPDEKSLNDLLIDSVAGFVDPQGWGWVKDRDHVAGFDSHGFREGLREPKGIVVKSINLMGLLVHKEPVVYVSDHLPEMNNLKQIPVRPLDTFETQALVRLRAGEDLVAEPAGPDLRLVGAIRNARQCVDCHGGKRGDLLGAFSYVLRVGVETVEKPKQSYP